MAKRKVSSKKDKNKKIFVLDSSAILHDHNTINNFSEHDVAVPISVLEELDNFKKGNDTINFTAREFIRFIDSMSGEGTLSDWKPLGDGSKGRLKVVLEENSKVNAQKVFGDHKADHRILDAALHMKEEYPDRMVILVSKDINLRVKAKSLDMLSEDYETGKVKDIDKLYTGKTYDEEVDGELIAELYKEGKIDRSLVFKETPTSNHYFILKNLNNSVLCYYNPNEDVIELVDKSMAYGVKPRNAEQTFALHAILNPDVRLISIQGVAGTGKTLLALAGALEQRRQYRQIYLARPIIPLSNRDIGYLPGDAKMKIDPTEAILMTDLGETYHSYTTSIPAAKYLFSFENYYKTIRGQSGNEFYRYEMRLGMVRGKNYGLDEMIFRGDSYSGLVTFDPLRPEVKRIRLSFDVVYRFDAFNRPSDIMPISFNCERKIDRIEVTREMRLAELEREKVRIGLVDPRQIINNRVNDTARNARAFTTALQSISTEMEECFISRYRRDEVDPGNLVLSFTVETDGTISSQNVIEVTGINSENFMNCILDGVRTIKLDPIEDMPLVGSNIVKGPAKPVNVIYPVEFTVYIEGEE